VYIGNHPVDLILSGSSVFLEPKMGMGKRLVEGTKGLKIYVVIMKSMLFDVDYFGEKKGW
jgi:hypothetical protein